MSSTSYTRRIADRKAELLGELKPLRERISELEEEFLDLEIAEKVHENLSIYEGETLSNKIWNCLSHVGDRLTTSEITEHLNDTRKETAQTTVASTLSRMGKNREVSNKDKKWYFPQKETPS